MSTKIKIGHATISEKGTAYGEAGDQKGNEVCIVDDYDIIERLSPNVLLRPNTSTLAEASAKACEAGCANNNIGYSQSTRNTLNNLAKDVGYDLSKVTSKCNTDCSAFVTVCAIAGGSKISYGSNAPTTSNMRTRFKQSGDYTVLTDSKHLTQTDYLKRGDILVHEGSHTIMVLENGSSHADEIVDPDIGGSTIVTSITDITVFQIAVHTKSIDAEKATFSIKAIEQKSGMADKEFSSSKINKYDWYYELATIGKETILNKSISLSSSKKEISISSLKPDTAYAIRVLAKNKKTGNKELCSQKIIFTTLPANIGKDDTKQEFVCKSLNTINHIYIKVNDKFKPVILHNK